MYSMLGLIMNLPGQDKFPTCLGKRALCALEVACLPVVSQRTTGACHLFPRSPAAQEKDCKRACSLPGVLQKTNFASLLHRQTCFLSRQADSGRVLGSPCGSGYGLQALLAGITAMLCRRLQIQHSDERTHKTSSSPAVNRDGRGVQRIIVQTRRSTLHSTGPFRIPCCQQC